MHGYLACIFLIAGILSLSAAANAQDSPGVTEKHSLESRSVNDPTELSLAVLSGEALFPSASSVLTETGVAAINRLIDDLGEYAEVLSVRIVGHTDSDGTASYNRYLSEQRALYLASLFSERLPSIPVVSFGAGESRPIASNSTQAGRETNRRVEIQVLATGIAPKPG
jgi:outer membrane protein OmpA-like peptidoglycan-associated protein